MWNLASEMLWLLLLLLLSPLLLDHAQSAAISAPQNSTEVGT